MQPFLSAAQVTFHRHNERVFHPVNLTLSSGEIALITGENGSGKTTLIRMLSGIVAPSEGQIDCSCIRSFIGHEPAVKSELSCIENLAFFQRFYPQSHGHMRHPILDALKRVGLGHRMHHLAGQLSAGQRRRLGLARLLVAPSDVWLLDEPYTSLDASGCEWVDQLLADHLTSGGAAIVTAHHRQPKLPMTAHALPITAWEPALT